MINYFAQNNVVITIEIINKMENKTHWKKNNDSRYISGEDLKFGISINKGLRPEMIVKIVGFKNSETFDQNNQEKIIKTGFNLVDCETNKNIYKSLILNNTNGDFCTKEFKSEFIEDWLNKELILYAKPDRRHGFVARFKKYYPKVKISDKNGLTILNTSKDLDELIANWNKLSKEEKTLPTINALKDKLKNDFK